MGMDRDEVIRRLRSYSVSAAALGVHSLHLFGSVARNEADAESDVDVFVDYDPNRFGLVELARLRRELTDVLGRRADAATRDGLHPMLRAGIEREAVQVF